MKTKAPATTNKIAHPTDEVPSTHPVEDMFARTTIRHQLGAGIPKNSPLATDE